MATEKLVCKNCGSSNVDGGKHLYKCNDCGVTVKQGSILEKRKEEKK